MKIIPITEAVQFLYDNGLLFEINRQVLHPLGYALRVIVDENTGEAFQLDMVQTSEQDGIIFGTVSFNEGYVKLEKFMTTVGLDKMERRLETLGYIVQEES